MDKRPVKLSIVVPCYNEEETVSPLFNETLALMREHGVEFEMIFVNDGSSDGTMAQLRAISERAACRVRIIDFSRNFGKEAGIYAGLEQSEGEYTVVMDGDMQQSPAVVLEMLELLEREPDYDCVAAVQEQRRESALLCLFKRGFYRIINSASQVDFVSGASDFRMFRRPMVEAILSVSEYFRFSKGIFSFVGFKTRYLPYVARERGGGETKWSFSKLFKYAMDGIISFTTVPLKFTTYAGLISSTAAFVYFVAVVVQKLFFGVDIPGYPTIVCLILLLGGLQLLGIGVLGEYLGRNYVETKKRPIYISRQIIDNQPQDDRENEEENL